MAGRALHNLLTAQSNHLFDIYRTYLLVEAGSTYSSSHRMG